MDTKKLFEDAVQRSKDQNNRLKAERFVNMIRRNSKEYADAQAHKVRDVLPESEEIVLDTISVMLQTAWMSGYQAGLE